MRRARCSTATALAAAGLLAVPASAADTVNTFGGTLGLRYEQLTITVAPGDTVTFQGEFDQHPLRSARSDTPFSVSSGTSFTQTYRKPGIFRYYCALHGKQTGQNAISGMSGQVIVGDPKTLPPAVLTPVSKTIRFSGSNAKISYKTDTPGELGLTVRVRNRAGKPSGKNLATGKRSFDSEGTGRVAVRLTRAGKRKLKLGATSRVVLTARFDDIDGRPSTKTSLARVRR